MGSIAIFLVSGSFLSMHQRPLIALKGSTSTAAIMAVCLRQSATKSGRLMDSEQLRFIVDCAPLCDEAP